MNETTTELLKELAARVGTTTEYLWGVLVKQAPISGVYAIVVFCVLICATSVAVWFSEQARKKDWGELLHFWGTLFAVILIVTTLGYGLTGLKIGIYGILNPEYWALLQLLDKVK